MNVTDKACLHIRQTAEIQSEKCEGFEMERERSEVNRVAAFCHTIIAIALLGSYALEVVKGARTITYYAVFAVLAVIPVIAEWILYKRNHADRKIQHVLGFGYAILYIFIIFTTTRQ